MLGGHKLGLTVAPQYGSWLEPFGYAAAGRLLDQDPTIDALICGNDQVASGALPQLERRQLVSPDPVMVVGFENWPVLCHYVRRPFSSDAGAMPHLIGEAWSRLEHHRQF